MNVVFSRPIVRPDLIGNHHGHAAALERVTVAQALGDHRRQTQDVLNLFWRDVLTLRQLEDVLRPVNDLDCAIRVDLCDVTRVKPAVSVEGCLGLLGIFVVARENRAAIDLDLTSWIRLVCHEVLHVRDAADAQL